MHESKALLERGFEKLEVAKFLFENGYYSDSVSRAYYAMFFAARALLVFKKIYPKTHRGTITQIGLEFVNKGYLDMVYAKALATAQEDREEADYGVVSKITKEEAEEILNDGEAFIEKTKDVFKLLGEE
mgnify:CR=1 FL=1